MYLVFIFFVIQDKHINQNQEERHPNKYAMEEISGATVPLKKRGFISIILDRLSIVFNIEVQVVSVSFSLISFLVLARKQLHYIQQLQLILWRLDPIPLDPFLFHQSNELYF